MQKFDIKLSLAENVKNFVNIASKFDFDMDLRSGRHVVDAKSILGIFSLDLSKSIALEVDDEKNPNPAKLEELKAAIKPFLA